MAATDVQSLFLQVDASVELLRRNLAAGEQPLDRFEQRAARMSTSVDKSIGQMGTRFGEFAKLAENAASQAQRSFDESFSQIQKMAANAITAPTVKGGGLNLGAAEARQAAEAARQQAQALGLIERAARAAAAGEGVMTMETRLYLQAAQAARIEGERHAAELMREAGALERLEIETRAAAAGHQILVGSQRNAVIVSGQQRQSTMMLGQQTQDFFVQVMSGQSAITAFVQQIGQAAFAVQGMGGRMASVGAFLGSGWGAAILVATTVLVPLIGKMLENNDALDEALDKLKKDAAQTDITNRARAIFTKTIEGQIEAQRELNKEMARGLVSQSQLNQQNLETSRGRVNGRQGDLADRRRELVTAAEQYRRADARVKNPSALDTTEGAQANLVAAQVAEQRMIDAHKRVKNAERALREAKEGVRSASVTIAVANARAAVDPVAAITKRYEDQADAMREAAQGSDELTASLERRLIVLGKQQAAEIKVEQDRQSAEKRLQSDTRNGRVTPDQVGRMLKEQFGGTITSTTGGKHVANSYHYRAQAVDFVPRGGMGAVSKDQIRAYLESQGLSIKELLGPGDKKHSDHFHVAFSKTQRSQTEIASRIETAQNAILADQISYAEQERQARRRLLDAQGRSATTEEERDRLAREEIDADYSAQKTKIAAMVERKDRTPAQAAELDRLNEQTRDQRLTNVQIERARLKIANGYEAEAQSTEAKIAMLRIEGDMAVTAAERRRIAMQLLELEQEQRRRAIERVRDTSDDPSEVQRARDALTQLPAQEGAERAALEQRNAGPVQQYVTDLRGSVGDMGDALEGAAVRGFGALENSAGRAATKLLGVRGVLGGIVGDLVQIAIRKLALEAIGSGGILSAFGLAGGGKVEGRAGGGKVSGPGTGTSDSILAMLGSKPIMLSNGESIVTAAATAQFWPLIDAMNKGRIRGFAGGGLPSMSIPSTPRLPSFGIASAGSSNGGNGMMLVKVDKSDLFDVHVQRITGPMAQAAAVGGSQMAQQDIAEQQSQALS